MAHINCEQLGNRMTSDEMLLLDRTYEYGIKREPWLQGQALLDQDSTYRLDYEGPFACKPMRSTEWQDEGHTHRLEQVGKLKHSGETQEPHWTGSMRFSRIDTEGKTVAEFIIGTGTIHEPFVVDESGRFGDTIVEYSEAITSLFKQRESLLSIKTLPDFATDLQVIASLQSKRHPYVEGLPQVVPLLRADGQPAGHSVQVRRGALAFDIHVDPAGNVTVGNRNVDFVEAGRILQEIRKLTSMTQPRDTLAHQILLATERHGSYHGTSPLKHLDDLRPAQMADGREVAVRVNETPERYIIWVDTTLPTGKVVSERISLAKSAHANEDLLEEDGPFDTTADIKEVLRANFDPSYQPADPATPDRPFSSFFGGKKPANGHDAAQILISNLLEKAPIQKTEPKNSGTGTAITHSRKARIASSPHSRGFDVEQLGQLEGPDGGLHVRETHLTYRGISYVLTRNSLRPLHRTGERDEKRKTQKAYEALTELLVKLTPED